MNTVLRLLYCLCIVGMWGGVNVRAFTPSNTRPGRPGLSPMTPLVTAGRSPRTGRTELFMASKAKFGIFSPAVYLAKFALGNDKLNKIRGKAISLHSQYIGDFCDWAGAYHLRTRLIKKAKQNGDTLGFLV